MSVTNDKSAPYAPARLIISLVERHRAKGLPKPIDGDVLIRAGVSDSLAPRTLYALHALDLIDSEGVPTQIFEGMRLAPEADYKKRVGEWLNEAYADALNFVDPSSATDVEIRDAFRSYRPTAQQDRMVSLFLGLFRYAGIREDDTKAQTKSRAKSTVPRKVVAPATERGGNVQKIEADSAIQSVKPHLTGHAISGLPPALSGLLASLPETGNGWSGDTRNRFVTTFQAVLDFCYPIEED